MSSSIRKRDSEDARYRGDRIEMGRRKGQERRSEADPHISPLPSLAPSYIGEGGMAASASCINPVPRFVW